MSLSLGRVRFGRLAPIAVLVVVGALVPAVTGTARAAVTRTAAAATTHVNPFTCAADPLRITPAGKPAPNLARPCHTDTVGGAQSTGTVGSVQVSAVGVSGATSVSGGLVAEAASGGGLVAEAASGGATVGAQSSTTAKSARVKVGRTVIALGAMTTKSAISCTYSGRKSTFSFHSTSSVASVAINGKTVPVGTGAKSIPLPGGATLMLNHSVSTATGVVQHAAMLNTSSGEVVFGESAVGLSSASANPCRK